MSRKLLIILLGILAPLITWGTVQCDPAGAPFSTVGEYLVGMSANGQNCSSPILLAKFNTNAPIAINNAISNKRFSESILDNQAYVVCPKNTSSTDLSQLIWDGSKWTCDYLDLTETELTNLSATKSGFIGEVITLVCDNMHPGESYQVILKNKNTGAELPPINQRFDTLSQENTGGPLVINGWGQGSVDYKLNNASFSGELIVQCESLGRLPQCTGTRPTPVAGELWVSDGVPSVDTPYAFDSSLVPTGVCMWGCETGFIRSGNTCVPDTPAPRCGTQDGQIFPIGTTNISGDLCGAGTPSSNPVNISSNGLSFNWICQ